AAGAVRGQAGGSAGLPGAVGDAAHRHRVRDVVSRAARDADRPGDCAPDGVTARLKGSPYTRSARLSAEQQGSWWRPALAGPCGYLIGTRRFNSSPQLSTTLSLVVVAPGVFVSSTITKRLPSGAMS